METYTETSPVTPVLTVLDIRKAIRALEEYASTLPSVMEVKDANNLIDEIKKQIITLPAKEPPYTRYFLGLRIIENPDVPENEAWIKHNDGRLLNIIKF